MSRKYDKRVKVVKKAGNDPDDDDEVDKPQKAKPSESPAGGEKQNPFVVRDPDADRRIDPETRRRVENPNKKPDPEKAPLKQKARPKRKLGPAYVRGRKCDLFPKGRDSELVDYVSPADAGIQQAPSGIKESKGFRVYVRGVDPSSLGEVTLMGINVPIRIGAVTVMPGDVVLSDPEGLIFIPPQLVETVATSSELTRAQDGWGHQMLREGKYAPGQIDGRWSNEMIDAFNAWAAQHGLKARMKHHK